MMSATQMPPCGAGDAAPSAMDSAPVTAPPTIMEGMTRSGSDAANGIAPSEMKDAPRSQEDLPFSRSAGVNRRERTVVASARASGGTMPAAMTAAMIFMEDSSPVDSPAVAKRYAALFTGPPRSKHIMSPRMMPSSTAEDPDIVVSQFCSPVIAASRGRPSTRYIAAAVTNVARSGMTTTGIMPASHRGARKEPIARATSPATMPVTSPPRKPAPMPTEIAPPTNPGAMPGRPARA